MNAHQLGRFEISQETLRRWEDTLIHVMGNFVVVDARHYFDRNTVEYLAYSPLFEPVPENCSAPHYEIRVQEVEDAPAIITAVKVDPTLIRNRIL